MAARAARFWMFIGGSRPAAATAADSFWALRPGKYMSGLDGTQNDETQTHNRKNAVHNTQTETQRKREKGKERKKERRKNAV